MQGNTRMNVARKGRQALRAAIAALLLAGGTTALAENIADLVSNGKREQALVMLETGTDVNARMVDGATALLYAAYYDDRDLVAALLEAGADPNIANHYDAFPLAEAAQNGNAEIIRLLLEHGANPNQSNAEGESALMVAARSGSMEAARLLLKHGADVNNREQWGGQTAIMWAAAQSQVEMLELLLQHGADPNLHGYARLWDRRTLNEPRPKDMNKGGFSAVLYAAREGCTACIPVLAKGGADLNAVDPDRVSALNLALINMHFETAMALIEAGADVNQWDLFGRAPLFNAIDLNTLPVGGRTDIPSEDKVTGYDVARALLERGANPNMQLKVRPPYRNAIFDRGSDNVLANGATPLIRAARAADNPSVELLLEYGALVDLPNSRGHTPLMIVSGADWSAEPTRGRYKTEEDSIETIRILLEHGANINARTGDPARRPRVTLGDAGRPPAGGRGLQADGQNALHAAARVGWLKIAQFLIDNGIEQQVKDTAGRTPYDLVVTRPPADGEPLPPMATLLADACAKVAGCVIEPPAAPAGNGGRGR